MNSKQMLLGVLGGIAAGALLGILFAPEKGSKTRRRISEKGGDFADTVKGKLNELLGVITEKFDQVKEETRDLTGQNKARTDEV
jgi:gas vesicle protein